MTNVLNGKIRIISELKVTVLYGCETWTLISREEHRLKILQKMVLRMIFEPRRDEVTGGWRTYCNEDIRNLCSSPSIIRMVKSRRMKLVGYVTRFGEKRNA
jgi:hypothetical protein